MMDHGEDDRLGIYSISRDNLWIGSELETHLKKMVFLHVRFVKDDRINWLVSNKVPDYTIIYNQIKSQKFCTAIKKKVM